MAAAGVSLRQKPHSQVDAYAHNLGYQEQSVHAHVHWRLYKLSVTSGTYFHLGYQNDFHHVASEQRTTQNTVAITE